MQPGTSDGPREKDKERDEKRREESKFITVNANERVPLYNSLSLSALMPESRSGKSAYVQYVYFTAV